MNALTYVLIAAFIWAECWDCVGLRTALVWWHRRRHQEHDKTANR